MHDWTGSTLLLRPKLPVAQLRRVQNLGRRPICRLPALGSLQHCRELGVHFHSQRHTGSTNFWGASEDCCLRIRLHNDLCICIKSSGRYHIGFIGFAFQDTTGASTTYGEWQQCAKPPQVPTELVLEYQVCSQPDTANMQSVKQVGVDSDSQVLSYVSDSLLTTRTTCAQSKPCS